MLKNIKIFLICCFVKFIIVETVVLKFHSFPPMPANSNAKFVNHGEIKLKKILEVKLKLKFIIWGQVRDGVVDLICRLYARKIS